MLTIPRSKYVVFNEDEDADKPYIPMALEHDGFGIKRVIEEEAMEIPYKKEKWDPFIDNLKDVENSDFFNYGKKYCKKTILNSDKAALKYCEMLLAKMRKKGKTLFEDPDFGPKYKGDIAQDSIYFEDIPKGYPQPKNMEWCRPAEIAGR